MPTTERSGNKYSSAFIPGLEYIESGLGTIPGCDTRDPRFKEPDAEWRLQWFDWRKRVAPIRTQIHLACSGGGAEMARKVQRELCARDWAYFTTMFCWTFDPRLREGESTDKPFVPFAIQANKIQEFQRLLGTPGKVDIFDSKSRGIGWTETYAAGALAAWLFTDYQIHFVSYKEDKVYQRNNRSTIFGKIEYKINKLPLWFLPAGFEVEDHMLRLNLHNPDTGASITGESTTSRTARSDRKTGIVYDEAAFVEGGFKHVYSTGAGTTDNRFALSTESWDEGMDWEEMWTTKKKTNPDAVWEIDWWHNPYQDATWYAAERKRAEETDDLPAFAREYERNAEEAATSLMYPEVRHCRRTEEHFDPTKTLIISIDPGHADDTAISWGQVVRVEERQGIRWLGNYKRNRVPVQFYAHLLTGVPPDSSDECWNMWTEDQFSERDKRLMKWFYDRHARHGELQEFVRLCMDPAGADKHAGISFFDLFYAKTQALRVRDWEHTGHKGPKPKGLAPNYKFLQEQGNFIVDRVACTRTLLPASEFSTADPDFWRALDIQDDLRRASYSEGTPRSISQPKPIHDETSHTRTTVEYASVYVILGMIDPPKRIARRMLDAVQRKAA